MAELRKRPCAPPVPDSTTGNPVQFEWWLPLCRPAARHFELLEEDGGAAEFSWWRQSSAVQNDGGRTGRSEAIDSPRRRLAGSTAAGGPCRIGEFHAFGNPHQLDDRGVRYSWLTRHPASLPMRRWFPGIECRQRTVVGARSADWTTRNGFPVTPATCRMPPADDSTPSTRSMSGELMIWREDRWF